MLASIAPWEFNASKMFSLVLVLANFLETNLIVDPTNDTGDKYWNKKIENM